MPRVPRNDIDRKIGMLLRRRRRHLGISMVDLSAACGFTYQQLQKYESGANKIAASLLYEIAGQLRVPVKYFFDDLNR